MLKFDSLLPARASRGASRFFLAAVCLVALCSVPSSIWAAPIDDYNLAVKFFEQKRWPLVVEMATDFLEAAPQHNQAEQEKVPLARLYLGQSLANQKKYEEARAAFRDFLNQHPSHKEAPLATYRVGESSYFLGDSKMAVTQLSAFVSRYPNDKLAPWGRQYLGESLYATGKFADATVAFEEVVKSPPNDTLKSDAMFGLARSAEKLNKKAEARKYYTEVAATRTRRAPDALFSLGALDYAAGNYTEALAAFEKFEQQFPGSPLLPTAELNAGFAAYQLKDFDAARERFAEAVQRDEVNLVPRYWLALTSHAEGDFAQAETLFSELASVEGADANLIAKSRFYAGDSQLRTEKFAAAYDTLSQVAAAYPKSSVAAEALHEATEAAYRMGDFAKARQQHEQFVARFADSSVAPRQRLLISQAAVERVREEPADEAAFELARDTLSTLISTGGELELRSRLELARLFELKDETVEAINTLKPAYTNRDSSELMNDVRLLGASLHSRAGDAELSAKLARIVLDQSDGQDVDARQLLIQAESDRKQWAVVEQLLSKMPAGADHDRILVDVAEAAFAAEDFSRAAGWFEEAVKGDDVPVSAQSGLGYSLFRTDQFAAAADAFAALEQVAIGNDQLASTAAWMRGLSLQNAGKNADAQRVFEAGVATFAVASDAAADAEPDQLRLTNAYQMAKQAARLAREAGEVERADRYYGIGVEQLKLLPASERGDLDKLIHEWALLAYENDQFDRSDELFGELLSVAPKSTYADDAKLYLAESDFFAGRVDEANDAFRELITEEGTDGYIRERASLLLIDIAADREQWADLKELSAAYLKQFGTTQPRLYPTFRLGEAELRLGDYRGAIGTLQEARTLAKADADAADDWLPMVWVFLAEAAIQQKQYALVDSLRTEFGERFPESPFAYQLDEIVGRSFKNRAEFAKARAAFQRVVDSESGRRTSTAAKSQLLIAETFLLEKNFGDAFKAYMKVYVNYAFPEYQAAALFQAAACDESLQNWSAAAASYQSLIDEFPESQYAADAVPKLEAVKARIP